MSEYETDTFYPFNDLSDVSFPNEGIDPEDSNGWDGEELFDMRDKPVSSCVGCVVISADGRPTRLLDIE